MAAVCHGPAALLSANTKDGKYPVEGKRLAAFSNAEEEAAQLTKMMPFLLEYLWQADVAADERLATGQNPAPAAGVAAPMRFVP